MIEDLFSQLDTLSLKKNTLLSNHNIDFEEYQLLSNNLYEKKTNDRSNYPAEVYSTLKDISNKKAEIEKKLFKLGIEKITDDNLYYLDELGWDDNVQIEGYNNIKSIPPDLAEFANVYSIYIYNGTRYNSQNIPYSYRYIRVVDDKGYGGLRKVVSHFMTGENPTPSTVQRALTYTYKYWGTTLLTEVFPPLMVADYLIGMFTDIFDEKVEFYSSDVYQLVTNITTTMFYYYICDPDAAPNWKLVGVDAKISVSEVHHFYSSDSDGNSTYDFKERNFSGYTGWSWHEYIDYYLENPNAQTIVHRAGNFGYYIPDNTILDVSPKFAQIPLFLMK
ncbi:MAG: hypothetical protein E7481_08660 [Ruminococcaceae bacterium]|nr:hypothetical protein [Oscillospiraceae bacterium]